MAAETITAAEPTTLADTVEAWLASNLCDRCCAQAWVRTQTTGGSELLFCAHHFQENEPALTAQGVTVTADGRKFINASAS